MKLEELVEYVDTTGTIRIFDLGSFKSDEAIVQVNGCPNMNYWDEVISKELLNRDVRSVRACADALYVMVDEPDRKYSEDEGQLQGSQTVDLASDSGYFPPKGMPF